MESQTAANVAVLDAVAVVDVMAIEDEHQDILQNIEFGIVQVYQEKPDLIDAEVLTAIDALVRLYGAEAQGKTLSPRPVRGAAKQVMESVQIMCEWRLGRSPREAVNGKLGEAPEPEPINVIVACLKHIQASIKFWTQKGGRQGYLNFVKQFIV